MKILFDAGHGGSDPGAIGPTGLHEADVTLDMATRLQAMACGDGFTTALSRVVDRFISLGERASISNRWGADILVSIHCNAASSRTASGYEVWTTPGKTPADHIADCIIVELARAFPQANGRRDFSDGDADKEAIFAVLRHASAPAVLVEMGFISHAETEAAMRTDTWRDCMARAIMDGIIASTII